MEVQTRTHTIPAEPEVLEELNTLDDIPFGEPLSSGEERQIIEEAEGVEPKTEWDYSILHGQNEIARRFVEELRDAKLKLENPTVYQKIYSFKPTELHETKGMDLTEHLSIPNDPDEDIWQHIENHVQALYSLKLNRLNGEFKSRVRKLMEGVNI